MGRAVVIVVLALLVVGSGWAVSSPVGSSPDDDFHLGSIWCGAFVSSARCEHLGTSPGAGQEDVLVPAPISATAIVCFAFKPDQDASCASEVNGNLLSRANEGLYPSAYYGFMGLLVTSSVPLSVFLMRMASWVVSLLLLGTGVWAAAPAHRRPFLLAVLATSVPLMVFVMASTNPSGVASAAVIAYSFALLSAMTATETTGWRRNIAVASGAAVIALGSRPDAPVWIAFASIVVVLMYGSQTRSLRRRLIFPIGVVVLCAIIMLVARDASSVARTGLSLTIERSPSDTWFRNIVELPSLWTGSLGTGALGWLDTPLPAAIGVGVVAICAGLVMVGLAHVDRAKVVGLGLVVLMITAYPLALLSVDGSVVGEGFQSRYLLPVIPFGLAIALLPAKGRDVALSRVQVGLVGSVVVVANAVALHTNFRRYQWGLDDFRPNIATQIAWQWPGTPNPLIVWTLTSIAAAVAVAALVTLVVVPRTRPG